MTFFGKSIWSLVLCGSALLALFTMFELLGRKEKRLGPGRLRTVHRLNGIFFFVLYVYLSYLCLKIMRASGGHELSARVALHGLLAFCIFPLLGLKLLIVRFYRQYYSWAAPLGVGVFLFTLAATATSAGYYFVVYGGGGGGAAVSSRDPGDELARRGAEVFNQNCLPCHHANQSDTKVGPGLKGLFHLDRLPSSGLPPTEEHIRQVLKAPVGAMPSFGHLSEEEVRGLLTFLKTL